MLPHRLHLFGCPQGICLLIQREHACQALGPAKVGCLARVGWVHNILSRNSRKASISARTALSPDSYWATTALRCRANIRLPVASAFVAWAGVWKPNRATNSS